ncbi:MAG TPA: zf-HC2 domain-containing protein [Steroidobacter sp.]|uniref:anti-sigma factor family protein n=1 Tax=Steroidobacter sp. TaxID=1978227 RepID=UPI002ED9596A
MKPNDHSKWDDSLQDWLDGELNDADRAAFEAHLARCELCQGNLGDFEALDAALVEAAPPMELNTAFDQQLFAKIDAIDETKRVEARRRLEQEWQDQMNALARNWRRTLAFVIPGVVAGIVLAFALMSWLDSSGITNNLVAQGAAELGGRSIDYLRLGITAVVGAAFGMLVAPWLARLAD